MLMNNRKHSFMHATTRNGLIMNLLSFMNDLINNPDISYRMMPNVNIMSAIPLRLLPKT